MAATDKPDRYEKLALLQMLTHGHAQSDAYFDTIGDAAALAANQVQDIRLEHLEKGPTVTPADVVLELLLAMALQHVGGVAVAAATRAVMTRVLASRRALLLVTGRTELGDRVAATYRAAELARYVELGVSPDVQFRKGTRGLRQLDQLVAEGDAALRETLLRQGDQKALYTDTPFEIADLGTKIVFNAARQVPQKPSRYTRLTSRDSPGVAVLDNAAQFLVRQKTLNKVLFDNAVHVVLLDLLSRDDVLVLIKQLEAYTSSLYGGQPLTEIKQHYKIFFEACVWSRILYPPPTLEGVPPIFDLGDRGRDLTEYLLARLVNPEVGVPFGELIADLPPHARRRSDETTNQFFVLQSLLTYFRTLRDTADQLEARLPTTARTRWNYQ
jgi:hypothetical protein